MRESTTTHGYDDIIDLPHPTSPKHPRMSAENRAAQFGAFAALTGHSDAIKETARLVDRKLELDEDAKARLDERLQLILAKLSRRESQGTAAAGCEEQQYPVTITYFVPDERKTGGRYETYTGTVRKFDSYRQTLTMEDRRRIAVTDISEIEGDWLED